MAPGPPSHSGTLSHQQRTDKSGHRGLPMEKVPASQIPTAQIFPRPLDRGRKTTVGRIGEASPTRLISIGRDIFSGPGTQFLGGSQNLISDFFVIFEYVPYL